MTSGGGDRSTRAKEDGVGTDPDFVLVLDDVDALDESVEPPVMRLDPVQVAGIYESKFNCTIRAIYVPRTHLEFTFGVDRHPTTLTSLSQFAETPDRSLGSTRHKFRHGEQWDMSFYLTVATSGWYGKRRALELVRSLFPLIAVEGFTDRFYLCEQNMLRCRMGSQVMHRINKVLSAWGEPRHLTTRREHREAYEGNIVRISDVLRRENLL